MWAGRVLGLQAACKTAASFWAPLGKHGRELKPDAWWDAARTRWWMGDLDLHVDPDAAQRGIVQPSPLRRGVKPCTQPGAGGEWIWRKTPRGGFDVATRLSAARIINQNVSSRLLLRDA